MKFSVFFFLMALISGLFARPAAADDFSQWLATLKKDAQAQGVQAATIDAALHNVQPMPQILDLDRKQPETTLTLAQYLSHVVTPARIGQGRKLRAENEALLRRVAGKYGVAPKTIMALWAIESGYGHIMGDYRVVDTLVTLAYNGRRPDLFRAELIAALKIIGHGRLTANDLKGSWAGAMGQIQFMPTTYLKYGVDFDRHGDADIWRDTADVFASRRIIWPTSAGTGMIPGAGRSSFRRVSMRHCWAFRTNARSRNGPPQAFAGPMAGIYRPAR